MELLETRAEAALERAGYLGGGTLLVVAVSGGPDSLALLHALLSLKDKAGLRLHIAHLNHNFRGEEAEEDARFVSTAANRLGLPATVGKADPVAYQKEMGISSFEEAAREVRYSFLARVARDRDAASIALGHTSDDLAETVLMHIVRGSGIHGLRGMAELATWQNRAGDERAMLFRPFLQVTKSETLAYCDKRGIVYREDTGNRLMRFTRNRMRHELLPTLETYNPRIKHALARLAHYASLEVDYLEGEVAKIWPTVARQEVDSVILDARLLASLHPFMQRTLLRHAYHQFVGDTRRLQEVHLNSMADFIGVSPGRVLVLPRGLRLYAGYGQIILGHEDGASCPFPPLEGEYGLRLPVAVGDSSSTADTITEIPGWQVTARVRSSPEAAGNHLLHASGEGAGRAPPHPDLPPPEGKELGPFTACFDLEQTGGGLEVRTRQPGDRFQPLGMRAEKKLQDFFVDEKVPRAWRDRIPLLVSKRGIAWVVGYRLAEWARVGEDGLGICQIRFSLKV